MHNPARPSERLKTAPAFSTTTDPANLSDSFKRGDSFDSIGGSPRFSSVSTSSISVALPKQNKPVSVSQQLIGIQSTLESELSPTFSPVKLSLPEQVEKSLFDMNKRLSSVSVSANTSGEKSHLIQFLIKIDDETQEEFDTEHKTYTRISQIYADIAQLRNLKVDSFVLTHLGRTLPCDSTPLYLLIKPKDTVLVQIKQQPINSARSIILNSARNSVPNSARGSVLGMSDAADRLPSTRQNVSSAQGGRLSLTPREVSVASLQLGGQMRESQIIFNPDYVNANPKKLDNQMEISVRSTLDYLQLYEKDTQTIPIMISLDTKKMIEESQVQRPPIDLICVMDNSGSMHGEKLNMLKETLVYLIDQLNERDRLALVLFNTDVTSIAMKSMDDRNKLSLKQFISEIKAQGGTDINLGMQEAFSFVKSRKFANPVTSIFLLSDGLDSRGQERVANSLQKFGMSDQFSINCFGFGNDHDPILMNQTSQLKDGSFYFIDKIDQVDMYFIDALGGLFSVVGQEVLIKVKCSKELSKHIKFVRNYGDMWQLLSDSETNGGWEYCIRLNHLMHGVSKDFICELEIPACGLNQCYYDQQVTAGASIPLVQVELTVFSIASQPQKVKKSTQLNLQVYPPNSIVPRSVKDAYHKEVQMNFLRVKGAKALQDSIQEAQNKRYKQGQLLLTQRLEDIERAQFNNQAELMMLRNDLIEGRQVLEPGVFEREGLHRILANQRSHMEQRSKANNLEMDCYQNSMQKEMIKRRMREKGLIVPIPVPVDKPPAYDLFTTFCEAAQKANSLYILSQEIPNLSGYFHEQIEPRIIFEGSTSLASNYKLQECLSSAKIQALVVELNKRSSEVETARLAYAKSMEEEVKADVLKASADAGVELTRTLDGDISKMVVYMASKGLSRLSSMPELKEDLSLRQIKSVQINLDRLCAQEKVERFAKAKGIVNSNDSRETENSCKLVDEVLGRVSRAMKCERHERRFAEVEVLVKDVMAMSSVSKKVSMVQLDQLLDLEIERVQRNVLSGLQQGLFDVMTLKQLKDYFKQLSYSAPLFI